MGKNMKNMIYYLCAGAPGHHVLANISTNRRSLRKAVESLIRYSSVSYKVEDNNDPSVVDQIRQLRQDWMLLSRTELNDRLTGAYIGATRDGVMI